MNETDFPHVTLVRTWLQRLVRQHPEQRELVDDLMAEVATRKQSTLHYGALGLRVRIHQARDAGECSTTFQARADAVLFGLEVLADEDLRFGLAPDVVAVVVETALSCADDEIGLIERAVDLAGRLRWHELVEARTLLEAWTAQPVPAGWRSLLDTFVATLKRLEETPPQAPQTAEPPVSWSRRTPDREIENGTIRIGKLEFPVESAQLRYTPVPNSTIEVQLVIEGERREGLTLDLYPPPLKGRVLGDLTGQVQVIASPTTPALDSAIPNAVDTVAGIYVGTHESVHDSRIEWGQADPRSICVRWTGNVDDLDRYDGSVPRQPLVVDARALAVEVPYEAVKWGTTCADRDELAPLDRVRPGVLETLAGSLASRRWFDGMPFVGIEIVVKVEERGYSWRESPRAANARQLIVAKLSRAQVMSGDDALRRAIETRVTEGLAQLEQRYRQGAPTLLR
jgi:hypothetical protein